MRPALLVILCAGCGDSIYAEVDPSIGRVGAAIVAGRVLVVEVDDDDQTEPLRSLDDEAAPESRLEISVGGAPAGRAVSSDGGAFSLAVGGRRPAGTRRVVVRGEDGVLGAGRVTLLAPDRAPLVVTSDVDMTYLETRFKTAGEIWRLLRQPASRHRPLDGMPALYRRLRARTDALRFVSGSPGFFRRHLAARLEIDRIPYDELTLKPFEQIVARHLDAPGSIKKALEEQVGYKLHALLEGRCRLPRRAWEVLLGDDTEMDAYAYRLYRDTLAGELPPARLAESLEQLGVDQVFRTDIARAAARARAWTAGGGVVLIGIRETDRPNRRHPARRVADPSFVFHRTSAELTTALRARKVL